MSLCIGPIPAHLATIPEYAPHQAWMRDEGYLHHDPGEAKPVRARFVRASFDGARFDGARFDGASFVGASFDGASFVRASFDGASFDGARFDGASFVGASFDKETIEKFIKDFTVPSIPDLDSQLLDILRESGKKLDMANVHVCDTTHCRAGWYCHFTAEGKRLEAQLGWWLAGLLLYRAAHPDRDDVPNFFGGNAEAMESIESSAALECAK